MYTYIFIWRRAVSKRLEKSSEQYKITDGVQVYKQRYRYKYNLVFRKSIRQAVENNQTWRLCNASTKQTPGSRYKSRPTGPNEAPNYGQSIEHSQCRYQKNRKTQNALGERKL